MSFFLLLPSLLLASPAVGVINAEDASGNSQKRWTHRRLGGRRGGNTAEDGGKEAPRASDAFYDVSLLTEEEKLDMIKKALWLAHFGGSVDRDEQRKKFVQTVRESKRQRVNVTTAAASEGDNAGFLDTLDNDAKKQPQPQIKNSLSHQRRLNDIDGDVFEGYEYTPGACPNNGTLGVPCAPDDLPALCNKYDRARGSFRACLAACAPAFCCVHDAPRELNYLAPNCNTDENCDQYNYCYIAWWKLEDTVGPGVALRVEQDDDFYDLDANDTKAYLENIELLTPLLLHHFDDIDAVIEDGVVDNEFDAQRIFFDEEYWVYPVAGKVDLDNPLHGTAMLS